MEYFSLLDVTNPPLGWAQEEFVQALHIINKLSVEELHSIVLKISGKHLDSSVMFLPEESIPYILLRLSPEVFFEDAYDDSGVIGSLIQQKLPRESVVRY